MAPNSKITPAGEAWIILVALAFITIMNIIGFDWLLKSGYIGWAIMSATGSSIFIVYCCFRFVKAVKSWRDADN